MLLPNRHGSSTAYRYGFQRQEKDDEIKGEGNSINYTFRMHDPRVGRFFARDPLSKKYPHYSPYSFGGNKVIQYNELEGLEEGVPGMYSDVDFAEMAVATAMEIKHSFLNVITLGLVNAQTPTVAQMNLEIYHKVAAKQYADYGWLPNNPSPFVKWGYEIDPIDGKYYLTRSRPYIVEKGTNFDEFLGILGDVATVALALTPTKIGGLNTPIFLAKNPAVLSALQITSKEFKIVTYNFKHYVTKSTAIWKDVVKSTKNGPAKFKGKISEVDELIKEAWDNGTVVNNGKPWKVYKKEGEAVGAVSGKETQYMRVEMTPSTKEVHASPITETDYLKYTKGTE